MTTEMFDFGIERVETYFVGGPTGPWVAFVYLEDRQRWGSVKWFMVPWTDGNYVVRGPGCVC